MAPGKNPAEGYSWFLGSQLTEEDVIVLVAERAGIVVGYVYAGLEPRSWKELREPAGLIHDVAVGESSRRTGVATALVAALSSGFASTVPRPADAIWRRRAP